MPDAATASGGDTTAPNTKASGHVNPGMAKWAVTATVTVVKNTRLMASAEIGRMEVLNSCQDVLEAASYKRGGSIITKTTSGSNDRLGEPGIKPMINPAITNRIGKGNFLLLAIAVKLIRIAIMKMTILNSTIIFSSYEKAGQFIQPVDLNCITIKSKN